jgi:hypothetical protein
MGRKLTIAVIILLFTGVMSPASAETISYDFSKTYGNYEFSAQMAISIDGNKLTLTLDNTSPYFKQVAGSQTFYNAPAIVGFSFSVKNLSELYTPPFPYDSWDLTAFKSSDPTKSVSIKGIGEKWQKNSSKWGYNNFVIQNFDTYGFLYSPTVEWDKIIASSSSEYFTSTILEIEFKGVPVLDTSFVPYVKVYYPDQFYVSSDDQFIQGKMVATPETGTLLLLGIGLIGVAIVMREML